MSRSPLATRMRPTNLNEIVGQTHILAPGALLHRMIQADQLFSIILYGPPGTGKTTIANVIANTTKIDTNFFIIILLQKKKFPKLYNFLFYFSML